MMRRNRQNLAEAFPGAAAVIAVQGDFPQDLIGCGKVAPAGDFLLQRGDGLVETLEIQVHDGPEAMGIGKVR